VPKEKRSLLKMWWKSRRRDVKMMIKIEGLPASEQEHVVMVDGWMDINSVELVGLRQTPDPETF
jgi:hypothetical protein